jgi:hypothetical protein
LGELEDWGRIGKYLPVEVNTVFDGWGEWSEIGSIGVELDFLVRVRLWDEGLVGIEFGENGQMALLELAGRTSYRDLLLDIGLDSLPVSGLLIRPAFGELWFRSPIE